MTKLSETPNSPAAEAVQSRRVRFTHSNVGDAAIVRSNLQNNSLLAKVDRREKIVNVTAVCPFLAVVWVGMYVLVEREARGEGAIAMASIVTVLLGVLVMLWAWSSGRWWQFLNQARATAKTVTERSSSARMEIEVSPMGVRVSHDQRASEFGWKYFDRVLIVEEFVAFFFADALNGVAVPIAAFESRAKAEEFREFAAAMLEGSGCSVHDRWRVALSDRSLACPRCGYDLKGLTRAVCPECQQELDALSIRLIAELEVPFWTRLCTSPVWQGKRLGTPPQFP